MHPFAVMSDPIRRRIVEIIAVGEHTSGTITEVIRAEFGVSRSAVSKHLAVLRNAQWVDVWPDENRRHYILREDAFAALKEECDQIEMYWRHRHGVWTNNDAWPPPLSVDRS